MIEEHDAASAARCLKCGYQLHGLPKPVCPECGLKFDLGDSATFDTYSKRNRRRVKRIAIALGIVAIAAALMPRQLLKSNMTFTCSKCTQTSKVKRWELKPPQWIRIRYPAYHSAAKGTANSTAGSQPCTTHTYNVSVRLDMHNGGSVSATGTHSAGKTVTFNDLPATLDTAPMILKALMAPSNNGISCGRVSSTTKNDRPTD